MLKGIKGIKGKRIGPKVQFKILSKVDPSDMVVTRMQKEKDWNKLSKPNKAKPTKEAIKIFFSH